LPPTPGSTAPVHGLPSAERQTFLDDLNYLNTAEIRAFCRTRGIPYEILVEARGGARRTGENDRKGIILRRVRHFLQTGEVLPATCFQARVVAFKPLAGKVRPNDRLHYGQYDKHNRAMLKVLKALTDGRFRNGAVARILAREFWSRGIAPTFREFASAWLSAIDAHTRPNPEWAFLSDLANGKAGKDWKSRRARIALRVLPVLYRIAPTSPDRDPG
jgi:hypothetical protein